MSVLFQVNFDTCSTRQTEYSCSIFDDRHPSTVSMTVLVVVEMFNALNNLSENQSLLYVFFDFVYHFGDSIICNIYLKLHILSNVLKILRRNKIKRFSHYMDSSDNNIPFISLLWFYTGQSLFNLPIINRALSMKWGLLQALFELQTLFLDPGIYPDGDLQQYIFFFV